MNAETLFQHFDTISEAPDAVPRLRKFILELAVRGNLVKQDPADEPAAQLLQRIKVDHRSQDARRAKQDSQPLDPSIAPYIIPATWAWSTFGELVTFSAGRTPSRHDASFWNTVDYPWVSIADMASGGTVTTTKETVSAKAKTSVFKAEPIPAGTLLMSFKLTIGKVSRLGIPAFHNEAIISIFPYLDELDPFLFICLPLLSQAGNRKDAIKGATLNRESLSNLAIPLPPLPEQKRIVSKVNELMALCDELEAARARREARRDRLVSTVLHGFSARDEGVGSFNVSADSLISFAASHLSALATRPDHIKILCQSFYDLAVRGILVPQDPLDEPVNNLLQRVANEQSQSIAVGRLKLKARETTCNGPFELPASWRWVRLGDLIVFGPQNGVSPKPTTDSGAPKSLTLTATTSGRFDPSKFKHVDIPQRECDSYWLSPGDVLFQRGNTRDFVGIAAVYTGARQEFIFPDLMIRVRFSDHLDLQYLHTVLVSPPLRRYFAEAATGASATMPKISQSTLLNAPVPIPPLAEQRRIVAKMEGVLATCDALKERLIGSAGVRSQLLGALLHETLNGPTVGVQAPQPGMQTLSEIQPVCAP
ncbi:MAG TPA: restriction endonuclease subunit S [Oscillatoriaceae cyanobacterium]